MKAAKAKKAMILAAGLGTRLRPITDSRPKALVEVSGRTLLEITLERLRQCGVEEVIVNVHHFAGMIADYLQANDNFGMRVELSYEDVLLDTGGGLKNAAWFFLDNPDSLDEPFILHNVDILSTIDLERMVRFHMDSNALATLAVQNHLTARYLLFDKHDELCGWRSSHSGVEKVVRTLKHPQALGFTGIHIFSPRLLSMMTEEGTFSIIDAYLNLASKNCRIVAYRTDAHSWSDVGNLENLRSASTALSGSGASSPPKEGRS